MKEPFVTKPELRKFLVGRGVPMGVLLAPHPKMYSSLISLIPRPENNNRRGISVSKQKAMLNRTLESPLDGQWLMSISGLSSDSLGLQAALHIFCRAFFASTQETGKPFWHTINGNPHDTLRDDAGVRNSLGDRISLLVISNIAKNSTAMKFEKARDLLAQYSYIPRIVVSAGENPLEFCSTKLYVSPTRVLYFGGREEK